MFAGLRKKWRDQIGQTKTILGEKVREALASVVPITLIVLIIVSLRKKREDQPPASLGLSYFREER